MEIYIDRGTLVYNRLRNWTSWKVSS